jgi:signal transduction histidine kinase
LTFSSSPTESLRAHHFSESLPASVSTVAGVAGICFGALGLLAPAASGWAAMRPSGALAFIAAGLSLWSCTKDSRTARSLAGICAALVVIIAAPGAAETLLGAGVGFDGIFAKVYPRAADLLGRMDFITAMMFIALGSALILLPKTRQTAKVHALAFAIAVVALLSLAGDYFAFPTLRLLEGIEPHSAIGLLTLAVGIVCARPAAPQTKNMPAKSRAPGILSRFMPGGGARDNRSEPSDRGNELLHKLHESTAAIAAASDAGGARDTFLEKAVALFPSAAAITLRLLNAEGSELETAATRTRPGIEWAIEENQALGGRSGKLLSAKAPMIVRNLQTDGQVSNQLYRKQGWVSYLGAPLVARGEAIGIIGVYTREEYAYSRDEAEVLAVMAAAAAVAISAPAARATSDVANTAVGVPPSELTPKALQLMPSIYAALAPVNQTESLNEAMNGVVDKLTEATGADAGVIRLWKKETGASLVAGHRGVSEENAKQMEIGLVKGAFEVVVQTGEGIVAPDIDAEPRFTTKVQQQAGFHSSALLPLRMHNDVRGILYVASRNAGHFDARSKDVLTALAQQIGIAMENRELFDHLKNSRDEIEKASKIKGEFLSVMSHELRTPLSVVMGYAGMIKEKMLGEINPQQDDALQKLLTRANDQLNMINAIMQITQLESRSLVLERHLVNVTEMLAHLKSDYALAHTKKEVTLNWEAPAAPIVIVTDGGKLKEILVNLINNAIKFTQQGSVTIAMTLEEDHRKKWVQLSVADTGVGIPKDQFSTIFEKFYQVDSSETRLYGGVGLGLYIVKHFAAFLGGKVEVKSEPGRGSIFIVTIPYAT